MEMFSMLVPVFSFHHQLEMFSMLVPVTFVGDINLCCVRGKAWDGIIFRY